MSLRKYLLDAALERVISGMSLRRPQHDALQEFHKLTNYLPNDICKVPVAELRRSLHEYRPMWNLHSSAPHLSFVLATGVGKSRLMAALIAYLTLSNQARNFVLLAPRRTVLDKFLREMSPSAARFLFVDPSLVPNLRVWHSDNIEAFRDESGREVLFDVEPINVFVLSPQSLVGDDRRIADVDEFSGLSVQQWLKDCEDLVVISDEAHHLGGLTGTDAAAWTEAIRELDPKLHLLFTATPRLDANPLYSYDLATCLQEKLYTKDVRIIARERPLGSDMGDDDWDRVTLEFGLNRLAQKKAAGLSLADFPRVEPVMLVCCSDTAHADATAKWLVESGHVQEEQILVAHSKTGKRDEDLQRLLGVDRPGSPIRVVITVFQLTEGWDVSNVYVIAPLRSMSTFQGAVQTLGRGLRLPAGRRVDDFELDTLDMLCFGRQSLKELVAEATEEFGDQEDAERPIDVADAESEEFDRPVPAKRINLRLRAETSVVVPRMRIVQTEPNLDFEPTTARRLVEVAAQEFSVVARVVKKSDDAVRLPRPAFVSMTVHRVISSLQYLSLPMHGDAVQALVERFLEAADGDPSVEMIAYDWRLAGDMLSQQIDAAYRKTASTTFEAVGANVVPLNDQVLWVPDTWSGPLDVAKLKWSAAAVRQPVAGWQKCAHDAANFDTAGEFHVAGLIDMGNVDWWMRNDPAQIRLATPIGFYGPDFVVSVDGTSGLILLEVKRADFWKSPESDARIKSKAADAYCSEVSSATDSSWQHWVVLDEDAKAARSFEELNDLRVN